MAPAALTQGKMRGEVLGSHHVLGLGGIREEIICAAFLWVPGELICGMLRHLLCTFASTDASGQHRLSLHNSVELHTRNQ